MSWRTVILGNIFFKRERERVSEREKEASEAEDTVIILPLKALRPDSRQLAAHRLRTAGLYAVSVAKWAIIQKRNTNNFNRRRKCALKSTYLYQTLNAVLFEHQMQPGHLSRYRGYYVLDCRDRGSFPSTERDLFFVPPTQIDSGAHPASYAIGTGGKEATAVAQHSHHSNAKADNA